jgi:hypothetical protein
LIFVTGEEKSDWQHRADKKGMMPRYELFDEYWQASKGKAFFMASLSDFLELQKGEEALVETVRTEENSISEEKENETKSASATFNAAIGFLNKDINIYSSSPKSDELVFCPVCGVENQIKLGIAPASTAWCNCHNCNAKFATHRLRDGTFLPSLASIS